MKRAAPKGPLRHWRSVSEVQVIGMGVVIMCPGMVMVSRPSIPRGRP